MCVLTSALVSRAPPPALVAAYEGSISRSHAGRAPVRVDCRQWMVKHRSEAALTLPSVFSRFLSDLPSVSDPDNPLLILVN